MGLIRDIARLRLRLKYGVKEELLSLLRLDGIGRVRARLLFRNGIRDLGGVRNAGRGVLERLLGQKIAMSIRKQAGGDVAEKHGPDESLPNRLAEWDGL
jgi:helicase